MHFVLMPTTKTVKYVNGEKLHFKYSIKDSQNSFMLVGATAIDLEEALQQKIKQNLPIQPFILIKGSITNPEEIMVYFDGIRYQLYSILRALEVCLKIFFVFNLNYPAESVLVWSFIKQYFFNSITATQNEKNHPAVSHLINELDKRCS